MTDAGSATGHHFVLPEGNGDYYICENCGTRGAIITQVPVINPEEPVEEIQVGVDSGSNSVINSEVTSLIDSALKGEAVTSVTENVAESIVTAVENNEDITTEVVFDNNVSIDDAERELVENSVPTADGIEYFDLSIVIKSVSKDGSEKVLGNIRRISEMMTFTVAIPDDMIRENREFYIVRVHDGVAERLDTTMNADNTLTFQTDRFSTYAIAYTDKVVTEQPTGETSGTPATGDTGNFVLWIILLAVSGFSMTGTLVYSTKKYNR